MPLLKPRTPLGQIRGSFFLASALGLGALLWFALVEDTQATDSHVAAEPIPSEARAGAFSALGYPSGLEDPSAQGHLRLVRSWFDNTAGLHQGYTTRSRTILTVSESMLDRATGLRTSTTYDATTTYPIVSCASGGKDTWYTAGVDPDGLTVIDMWRLEASDRANPGATASKSLSNTELFRGRFEEIIQVKADPERRFVLALVCDAAHRQSIYKIPTIPNTIPQLVVSGDEVPELNHSTHLERFQHSTLGRIWIASDFWLKESPSGEVLLGDLDNDGQFESIQVESDLDYLYATGGLLTAAYITDTFHGND